MYVNNLLKVVTWQCTGRKSSLQPWGYKFNTSVVTVIKTGTENAFFSNTEPYQNCGFRLSIDGFSFKTVQL